MYTHASLYFFIFFSAGSVRLTLRGTVDLGGGYQGIRDLFNAPSLFRPPLLSVFISFTGNVLRFLPFPGSTVPSRVAASQLYALCVYRAEWLPAKDPAVGGSCLGYVPLPPLIPPRRSSPKNESGKD